MHGRWKMEYAKNAAFHRWVGETDSTTVRLFYLEGIHEHLAIQLGLDGLWGTSQSVRPPSLIRRAGGDTSLNLLAETTIPFAVHSSVARL